MFLVLRVFHRPIASHRRFPWANDRIKIRTRHIFEKVFGEEFAVYVYAEAVAQRSDLDPLSFLRRRPVLAKRAGRTSSQKKQAQSELRNPEHGF